MTLSIKDTKDMIQAHNKDFSEFVALFGFKPAYGSDFVLDFIGV